MSILVAGSLHLDVVVSAPHLPGLDETVTGDSVDYVFGGKGGNQAVAAARMGAQVGFAGRAGSDRFGDMLRETLSSNHVDTTQLQQDEGPSGMSIAIVNADGEYGAVIVSAANLKIDASQITVPETTSLVLLQNEIPQEVNLAVAEKARAVGANIWLNAAPARGVPDALIRLVDLLIVNRVEAAFYADDLLQVDRLTTLGAEGVLYHGKTYPGHKVPVISTHGAGDVFVGAMAARVANGAALPEAIGFAQAAAALHVSSELQDRSHLSAARVERFLSRQVNR
ncbi:MAG: PfkB family carbohydrate kinase [Pseudomonadota bacterium]